MRGRPHQHTGLSFALTAARTAVERRRILFARAGGVADLVPAAGEFGPVARGAGPGHLLRDVDLVEEALCHDTIPTGRSGPPVADGAFTHLQAVDRLALDHARQHPGGLSVTSLA